MDLDVAEGNENENDVNLITPMQRPALNSKKGGPGRCFDCNAASNLARDCLKKNPKF